MLKYVGRRIKKLHKWEREISTRAWVEKNVYLHSDASPITGMVRLDETPHIEGVFDLWDDHHKWGYFLNWSTQCGKALCLETPLLTTKGWTSMGELKVGDYLYNEKGEPSEVVYKSPIYNLPTFEVVFNTGERIKASGDHIWTVNTKTKSNGIKRQDLTTVGLLKDGLTRSGRPKHSIPFTEPLKNPYKELPIPPYTLGVWLGDGHSGAPIVTTHYADLEIFEYVKAEGVDYRIANVDERNFTTMSIALGKPQSIKCDHTGNLTRKGNCRFCHNQNLSKLYPLLKKEGLLNNKHIPEVYFFASEDQRISLLQGLMDTDGSIHQNGTGSMRCEFSSSIPRLADDFCRLLNTLGVKHTRSVKKTVAKDSHRINFKIYAEMFIPFKLKRKADKVGSIYDTDPMRVRQVRERYITKIIEVPSVPTQCITVDTPSHLFLAGEGLIATHNTFSMQCVWAKAMDTDPSRMQWSIKNKDDVGEYLTEKMQPFLRGVRTLGDKIIMLTEEKKKKQKAASIEIPGGGTVFTGTTAAERRSRSVKYYFGDEVALYGKGHLVELIGRTKFFERFHRKVMCVSSRKHEKDEMDDAYSTADCQLEWQTYCSGCGEYFYAGSEHLKFLPAPQGEFSLDEYRREAIKDVYIECPHCQYQIYNEEKDKNIWDRKYQWVPVSGDLKTAKTVGFKANALGTRMTPLESIATLWINSMFNDDPDVLAQFFIDYFNEFYEGKQQDTIEASELCKLGNGLDEWVVPKDAYKIYIGVDTQKDHFWVHAMAYCYGRTPHSIWAGRVDTFAELEDIWLHAQHLPGEDGQTWMASKMGIDRRGYNQDGVRRTDEVDAFVEYMVSKYRNGDEVRIYATEGHPSLTGDKAVQVINTRDLSNNRTKVDIKVVKMSNLYLKNTLYRSIQRGLETINGVAEHSSNVYFMAQTLASADMVSVTSKSFTEQMTSEVFDYARNPKTGKTDTTKTWVRIKKDNHLWDCAVICEAFAEIDKVSLAVKTEAVGIGALLDNLI